MPTPKQEIESMDMGRPHVVILGAGASLASCLRGDKYGKRIPLMNNLIEILNLAPILDKYNVDYSSQNFEEIYSNLYDDDNKSELVTIIENKVGEYFLSLSLPDYPTVYDYLVLSLREKDLIATFNWDPFLYQACCRHCEKASMPHTVYLHGNVEIGYCLKDRIKGSIYSRCKNCGNNFTPSRLLFPIRRKDYAMDQFIDAEWKTLKNYLKHAYILTIFGYGAPTADVEAIKLMKEAWGDPAKRVQEEIEIIDVKDEAILAKTWKDFICSHHYRTISDFYYSFIAKHPRRSCEAMFSCLMNLDPYRDNDLPRDLDFKNLYRWFNPLIEIERKEKNNGGAMLKEIQ